MSSAIATATHRHSEPVEHRACIVCGEIHDREVMSQCTTRGQFMCSKHACACPIPGIEELDAA